VLLLLHDLFNLLSELLLLMLDALLCLSFELGCFLRRELLVLGNLLLC